VLHLHGARDEMADISAHIHRQSRVVYIYVNSTAATGNQPETKNSNVSLRLALGWWFGRQYRGNDF
jgi:hypothetical protein